ncbi:ATP-binding protein [Enterocloster clostridioformis]|uniref:sensor histidine kinase n=1 Tax=Enterocloster clostridioformis TaxID=1531 RepID=UPI00080C5A94|nr:sensor histidine kinase [Enterocloster clostridioformis]ANU48771.1 hypothetical protein A4V08_26145 [Lachnoclostridium sp. YL32]NDO32050.1 GHKL domain-containing protein [Enterocloster clostridioformis]OXE63911.1 ATP-binding protein [Enterocloster clostridioformis]QQR02324.1 GHKL domain-containing protein [Enterocloster clostridioformis]
MLMDELNIIHIFCGLITTYVIYRFMNMFLTDSVYDKVIELLSYVVYFLLGLVCYFFIHIPIIMLIYNIFFFLILSLNYKADFKQRILAVIYIYSILFIIEMLVAAVSGYIHFPFDSDSKYTSIFGEIANQLIGLITVYLISTKRQVRENVNFPMIYWLCIIAMPLFSLYFLVLVFHLGNVKRIYMILCTLFLLIINFSIMVLYDLVLKSMTEHTRGLLLEQQNKYYERQFDLMKASAKVTDSLQHDLNKHLISVRSYLKSRQIDDAINYIDKMVNINFGNLGDLSKTGNAIIDSILNIKLQEAKNKDIIVTTKLQIPENLSIDSFDITVILGNIIDNAIEAASESIADKKLNIIMLYNRRRILVKVENTYSGRIVIKQGELQTTKSDSITHGIGLQNVKHVVERYAGTMDISYDNIWFKACVMLYI